MADTAKTLASNSHIALLVLSLIAEEPMYGYRIIKDLEARSESYFQMKEGSLYPVLHQLEKDGLVKTEWRYQKGKPNRRYYTITKKGLAALVHAKGEFEEHTKAMRLVMQLQG
jgi:PadR family transcriptional regulator, regulatory protein PadR